MKKEIEKAKKRLHSNEEKNEEVVQIQEDDLKKEEHDLKILKIKIKELKQIGSLSSLKIKELSR
jgi:hypothetical protein